MAGQLSKTQGRSLLPTNVKPINYHLELSPDLSLPTYEGKVVIDLDVLENSNQVSFHSVDIDIQSVHLGDVSSSFGVHDSTSITYDSDENITTATFGEPMVKGMKTKVSIKFVAKLDEGGSYGFYKASYVAEDGTKKWMACTQMEPTDARRAFPCMDEPALKATFEVIMNVDRELTCLANMDIVSETDTDGGKKRVTFSKSPLMSTYIVAFVIGELVCIETDNFHVPVRLWTVPGKEVSGRYSLDLTVKTLQFYEEAFGTPYPLTKIDSVAVANFGGAMENFGLIIYRESALLLDEATSSAADRFQVSEVVQHELAHQWFGNLVTMLWWNDLWLNEGFATWMSWYSCNTFFPEWKVWETFIEDSQARALRLDSLRTSHPIEVNVTKASEINQIFNVISYSKGASVIRMISSFLGEDVFMKGIRIYMHRHKWGNTVSTDLWAALGEASGQDVAKIMNIWTQRVGYPVLVVTETSTGIHIKQQRFLQTGEVTEAEDETIYPIFLALSTTQGIQNIFFDQKTIDVALPDLTFYKLNTGQAGFYRVSYTPSHLLKLGDAMSGGDVLQVEDRMGIIADASALASSGYHKTSTLLALLSPLGTESSSNVWTGIFATLDSIDKAWLFEPEWVREALNAFEKDLFSPQAHALGWEFKAGEDLLQQKLKAALFLKAGSAGDKKILAAAKVMFDARFNSPEKTPIDANIRKAVYAIVLPTSGEKEYELMLEEFRTTGSGDEREDCLRGMGYFRDLKVVDKVLALLLSEVKEQDFPLPLNGLTNSPLTVPHLWEWAKANISAIELKVGTSLGMLGVVVGATIRGFTGQQQLDDVEAFFKTRDTKAFDKWLAQTMEGVAAKSQWVSRDRKDIETWLAEKGYLVSKV